MLEKPDLPETLLAAQVKQVYGLVVNLVTFLPLGYDINTAVYRVEAQDGRTYFLKLRKGVFNPVTVDLPKYLNHSGITAIIAPLDTIAGQPYGQMDAYTIILYPFVPGRDGYEMHLTDAQWVELGRILRRVHDAQLPNELYCQIPHETCDPQWRNAVRGFLAQVDITEFQDATADHLAAFMREKRVVISKMLKRADELARDLQKQPMEFVLCHSDAHPGNYHITEAGDIYLVDWDNPVFAPRERDLMCFGGGMSGDQPGGREEHLFYEGYGSLGINRPALAYYRYERVIQDIAEFCKQIFFSDTNHQDRLQSYQYLVSSFQPNSLVEAAIQTDSLDGSIT